MPGETGVTVVTTLVCFVFYRTRDCGRVGRPAFPAPSEFQGGCFLQKLGRIAPRGRGPMLVVIARSEATLTVIASEAKQSIARAVVTMDCFVASLLAMTVFDPTLLAMTVSTPPECRALDVATPNS